MSRRAGAAEADVDTNGQYYEYKVRAVIAKSVSNHLDSAAVTCEAAMDRRGLGCRFDRCSPMA